MPSKKKKYNARFPPARIKKIMQKDEEVGKVAAPVPVIISRALELFVESLLCKTSEVTKIKNAKTLTVSHMKQCILGEVKFDFLKDLVSTIPDGQEDDQSNDATENSGAQITTHHRAAHQRRLTSSESREQLDGASSSVINLDDSNESDEDDEDEEEEEETYYGRQVQQVSETKESPTPAPIRTSVIHGPISSMQQQSAQPQPSLAFPGFYKNTVTQIDDDYDS